MRRFSQLMCVVTLASLALAGSARAEFELQAYGGMNTNFKHKVETTQPTGGINDSRTVNWDGKSFEMPPYWGIRGTWWMDNEWGLALDYTHTKAYADIDFATDATFDHLEFTDGNNLFIADLLYRWKNMDGSRFTPYVGGGVGVAIPHTEVTFDNPALPVTSKYEFGGPAAEILLGTHYGLTDSWGVFAEGKLSYSYIDADLDGGGSVKTQLWTPQLALGVSYNF